MNLKKIREATGLGLREAARLMGIHPSQLSEWENGHIKPDSDTLTRLADFYQERLGRPISLDEVTGRRPFEPDPLAVAV